MEKRRLGKTEHKSSVISFGGAALWKCEQSDADAAIELAIEHGVNHFDIGPRYGQAEMRLGPWMEKHHKEIFLACKTTERGKAKAWESIKRSLETLRVDHFDLFQFHAVNDLEALNVVLSPVGALQAAVDVGRHIPADLCIVGFDDIPLAALVTPSLTTCHGPRYDLGVEATAMLFDRIQGGMGGRSEIVLQPELIIRASAP